MILTLVDGIVEGLQHSGYNRVEQVSWNQNMGAAGY